MKDGCDYHVLHISSSAIFFSLALVLMYLSVGPHGHNGFSMFKVVDVIPGQVGMDMYIQSKSDAYIREIKLEKMGRSFECFPVKKLVSEGEPVSVTCPNAVVCPDGPFPFGVKMTIRTNTSTDSGYVIGRCP